MSLQGVDDDPFACFGESEDDDEVENETSRAITRSLVEQANKQMEAQRKHGDDKNKKDTKQNSDEGSDNLSSPTNSDVLELDAELELWPDSPPPLHIGPIRLVSSLEYGGGRGYVASRALDPGNLILVEEPMISWPQEQLGKALDLVSVQHILEHETGLQIVRDMEDFHPVKQEVDDAQNETSNNIQIRDMMQSLHEEQNKDRLNGLVQLAKDRQITCRNGDDISTTDIVRLLLALRYNGLETGVYRHVAMLNHNCRFNCVKYQPTDGKSYSEVRTTRAVAAGESLTISYLPGIVSHATRRQRLWDQHRFDIGDIISDKSLVSVELVNGELPPSSIQHLNETAVTFRIESACLELENMSNDIAALTSTGRKDNDINNDPRVWEQLRALELSARELYVEAKQQLQNDNHLLLIGCLRLHVDTSCDLLEKDPHLSMTPRIQLLCRAVTSAEALVRLQATFYGKDHFDVARTHLDLAETIEELLSRAPKELIHLRLKNMNTFEECSTVEQRARQEYERIRALYPHDLHEKIGTALSFEKDV